MTDEFANAAVFFANWVSLQTVRSYLGDNRVPIFDEQGLAGDQFNPAT